MGVILMSKKKWNREINKYGMGLIIASVGAGIVIAVILPIWGWIIAVGGGLIFLGWFLINNCNKKK
ncbi:hypothetical protein HGI32_09575 [Clostridium acetobutylicum]|uniref:Uncharacterized protein n=2 Tax=Clostridiaceae TaxID=31979 RepID=Q97IB8_CLOAB|nr:Hypothetical protein CA_C1732 [Clostridium acetobutylicum ATCC 824]AEI31957.1 hypothetical protein SMB_G1757 [Clostridium acetobutylicum DSM 1731]AWV79867.1 hypothetical protein DK921_07110 [Clostridium acetobutylicum]PSM07828.1 hypothetical protein C7T89_07110 [Clostridium sp. NJ4]MBC2394149.1 hypothetical protein [Clostridium acetobutylicum]